VYWEIQEEVAIEEREEEPRPEFRYRRALHLRTEIKELIEARHVVYSLSERDLRSRYSQMALGFLWNVVGPLALTFVITLLLTKAKVAAPAGVPKPVWIYTALMPWTFFSGSVGSGGTSLVSNSSLLNKVYVPREVFPISQIVEQIVDSTCSASAFIVILILDHFGLKSTIYWAPILFIIGLILTTAVTILLSGLTVYFRDLRQAIPVLLQLGLFFNPIGWDLSQLSTHMRMLFVAINPLAGVIDGLRRCMLYGHAPDFTLTLIAAVVSSVELCIAYLIFKQMEAGFADVA
jgi:lipopolysaccharide transport system permease protein